MKKKLTAFIIGAAIWFGMADAARQMDYLQSEAGRLVAKSSMFLFSFGGEIAPESTERKISEPLIAISTENALAIETNNKRRVANVAAKLTAKTQEKSFDANHTESGIAEKNDIRIRVADINDLISMTDEIKKDVHTLSAIHSDTTASLEGLKEGEGKRRTALRRLISYQRAAEDAGKKIQGQFLFEYDVKTPAPKPASTTTAPKTLQNCPVPPVVEKLKLKTVLLVPEAFREFGE
jgi:hypothetical protein